MKRWKLKLHNLVADASGRTWTTDGLVPFPLDGWNFARAVKARIGWWVVHDERFITREPGDFSVLQRIDSHQIGDKMKINEPLQLLLFLATPFPLAYGFQVLLGVPPINSVFLAFLISGAAWYGILPILFPDNFATD